MANDSCGHGAPAPQSTAPKPGAHMVKCVKFGKEISERVLHAYGKEACHFISVHTSDDVEHTQKAFEQLEKLPQHELDAVVENLKLSAELYRVMLKEVQARRRA